jgi:hypothetical protein
MAAAQLGAGGPGTGRPTQGWRPWKKKQIWSTIDMFPRFQINEKLFTPEAGWILQTVLDSTTGTSQMKR